MSEETTPSVEEIKERLKVEIPVEEDTVTKASTEAASEMDIVEELRGLGKQFADTLQTMWNSDERQRAEAEIRDGFKSFVDEVDKMIGQVRESANAAKMKEEATKMTNKVESSEFGRKAQKSIVQGLHWLSTELGKLADQFTPPEKEAKAEEAQEE
ncbi:MAG: hypothetical protein KC423_18295 [Anaerolineales bacterium]|nr:hypothetical protein [Anaerolineales bacterium]MCB9434770.1 hypothetical protein [Ardenticatenaceae bacterium]